MKKINTEYIISVEAAYKDIHTDIRWQEEKRFLGMQTQPAGFYRDYIPISQEGIEADKRLYVEGHTVYYYPYVAITMPERQVFKFFDSAEYLTIFMAGFTPPKWLQLG